jgi:hypothetical protein
MKSYGFATAVASVIAGAALFASTASATLDPIVIKVRVAQNTLFMIALF